MPSTTYFVQFSEPEDPGRWHTIARVDNHELAREIARLSEGGYMRTTVTSHYVGRAVSRSALRKEGRLQHAEWDSASAATGHMATPSASGPSGTSARA